MKEQILSIAKQLLKITDTTQDSYLNVLINEIMYRALSYTNLLELPVSVVNCLARLTVELYNKNSVTSGSGAVASISESGRTVSFDVGQVRGQVDGVDFNSLIELRSIRVVKW